MNEIAKPLWYYNLYPNQSTDCNKPQLYVCHRDHPNALKHLLQNKTFRVLLRILDNLVLHHQPKTHAFILKVIPKRFRLFHDMIWTQAGISGGWDIGHCEDHIDENSIVNAIFQFCNPSTTGGSTGRTRGHTNLGAITGVRVDAQDFGAINVTASSDVGYNE